MNGNTELLMVRAMWVAPQTSLSQFWPLLLITTSTQNKLYPDLGKAGSPYARSVVPQRAPPAALPDPGTIFDGTCCVGKCANPGIG